MRIVVDVSPLSHPRTGIGNYLLGMVRALAGLGDNEHELVCFAPTSLPGKRRIESSLSGVRVDLSVRFLPFAHGWRMGWSHLGRPALERLLGPFDVFHFSDWMFPPQRKGLRATTVHDLVPLRFPEWVTPRTRRMHTAKYRASARTCDVIFANSRFTADDVIERLGLPNERVRVAYPGVDERFQPEGETAARENPYVLTVSTLEPRKNLKVLLEAHQILRRQRGEVDLVVAGAEGWGDQPELAAPGVIRAGFVSNERLAALYRSAAAFAYPSRFEGFGMPILEALASGTPTVASSHPSLDEACGDVALRADPDRAEDFAASLCEAIDSGGTFEVKGITHARRFTWESCGRAVLAGYEQALDRQ